MNSLVLCALVALAQPEKPQPAAASVDQALATALKSHPDIKVAEAKLRLVQLEYDQAKRQTVQAMTAAESNVQGAEAQLKLAEADHQRYVKLHQTGQIPDTELKAVESTLLQARGEVQRARQQLEAAKTQQHGLNVVEAQMALAAAELEQTRLKVSKDVMLAFAAVQNAKLAVEESDRGLNLVRKAGGSQLELLRYQPQLLGAKAALNTAEAELAAAIGSVAATKPTAPTDAAAQNVAQFLNQNLLRLQPTGTAADKLKSLLDKPIKLDIKAAPFSDLMPEFIKQAGLDGITVRYPTWASQRLFQDGFIKTSGPYTGEKSLTAWFELMMDEFSGSQVVRSDELGFKPPYIVVVREYGLLIVPKASAPPDALTLTEFARAVQAEKQAQPKK